MFTCVRAAQTGVPGCSMPFVQVRTHLQGYTLSVLAPQVRSRTSLGVQHTSMPLLVFHTHKDSGPSSGESATEAYMRSDELWWATDEYGYLMDHGSSTQEAMLLSMPSAQNLNCTRFCFRSRIPQDQIGYIDRSYNGLDEWYGGTVVAVVKLGSVSHHRWEYVRLGQIQGTELQQT